MGKAKKAIFWVLLSSFFLLGGWVVLPQISLGAETLVICSWGGAYSKAQRDAYFKPFEEKTGIKVIDTGPPTTAKIKAMVSTGNVEWDVVDVDMGMAIICIKNGLLEKIDFSQFDKKLSEEVIEGTFTPYTVGTMFFSTIIAYRTDVFPKEHPKNWKEFWDVKRFPGPRCWMSGASTTGSLEMALLADGVPMDKLYPVDVDRAFKKLKELKPHVVKWWDTGSVPPQLLTDKEVVLTTAYHGRIVKIMEEGAPVAIEWNQGQLDGEHWVIPKGTKNYKNALKFIEFATQAENQANLVKGYSAGPVNKRAFQFINPDRFKYIPTSPENLKVQFKRNNEWWGDNRERVNEYWHKWVVEN